MRLHDIQIILSSSDISSKYQQFYQYQANIAQSQNAIIIMEQSNQKMTQTQELVQGNELKAINENENRFREWKKEHFNKIKEINIKKKEIEKDNNIMITNTNHIIDIRA